MFGGIIHVESTLGKGTCFSVILPLRRPTQLGTWRGGGGGGERMCATPRAPHRRAAGADPRARRSTFSLSQLRVLETCRLLVLESCRANGDAIMSVLKRLHLRKVSLASPAPLIVRCDVGDGLLP
jgi:hypothetical protein